MAKKDTAAKSAPADNEVIDLSGDDYQSLSPALEKVYAEMGIEDGGDANVYITRILSDGREAKVWNGPVADFDLLATARKIGSGDYRVKLYVRHESGRYVLKGNQLHAVQLTAEEDARLVAIRDGKLIETPTGNVMQPPADIARIVAEAVRAAMPAPAAPANNLGMLKEVAEIVRTLAPQAAPQVPQMNPMDLFRIAADFARRDDDDAPPRGQTSGMDVFYKLVEKFAPLFAETLTQQRGAAVVPNAPALNAPTPAASAQPNPSQNEEPEAVKRLRMGLQFLCMQAQAGNEPATYADMILDNVPEADLAVFLSKPDPIAEIGKVEPGVLAHREWFTRLLNEVRDALKDEEPGEGDRPSGVADA